MNDYFIRMEDARGVRRRILEASKASLHILRGYQQLQVTRSEKRTLIRSLRRELKELTMLVNHLDEMMPTLTRAEVGEAAKEPTKKGRSRKRKKSSGKHVYVGKPEKPRLTSKPKVARKVEKAPEPTKELGIHEKLREIEARLQKV